MTQKISELAHFTSILSEPVQRKKELRKTLRGAASVDFEISNKIWNRIVGGYILPPCLAAPAR